MKKELKHKQFLQMWYNRCGFQNKVVEAHMDEIYEGLLDTIREETRLNGIVRLKNLGKFYLLETGGFERRDIDGGIHFIPPYYAPKFTASQNFKDYVNDAIVSKEGRRNKKRNTLTQLEQELEEREKQREKTDIRRILERKRETGENVKNILKDTRMQIKQKR